MKTINTNSNKQTILDGILSLNSNLLDLELLSKKDLLDIYKTELHTQTKEIIEEDTREYNKMKKENTLNAINTKLISNSDKREKLNNDDLELIHEAIELVNEKISSISNNSEYKATERKAIKVIKDGMFTTDKNGVKLHAKLKKAIKVIVISHKRKVFENIDFNGLSVNKIEEMLSHLTVKEIKENEDLESINECLNDKKTRTVTTMSYPKVEK